MEQAMEPTIKKNILIIDDDLAMRECIAFFLEEDGHAVTVCEDGIDGVRQFEKCLYDLVITDIMMPGKDGLAALIEMQRINPDVKVIAISGADMRDALLDAASIFGAVHTIRKPFTRQQLLWTVTNVFDTAESTAARVAEGTN
jgi:CheY-like chemotaxis protein